MKKWLFNPFVYIAGSRSLLIGIAVMVLTAIIGVHSNAHFDGVIDMHAGRVAPAQVYFLEQLTDWGLAVILFYAAGLIFSKSAIRFVDEAGTMALARWPMAFSALLGFGIAPVSASADLSAVLKTITPTVIGIGLLALMLGIWMIVLMYHAFKVSCNLKGQKATGIFVVTLILSELFSHVILHQLYKHFI